MIHEKELYEDDDVVSVRDAFAIAAMQVVVATAIARKVELEFKNFAKECYRLADAMMEERGKK